MKFSFSKNNSTFGFTVNISKSHCMLLYRRHHCNQLSSAQLLLNGTVIQSQMTVKYLGVIVDNHLSCLAQIRSIHRSFAALAAI